MQKIKLPPRPESVCSSTPCKSISQIRHLIKEGKYEISPHPPMENRIENIAMPEDRYLPMNMLFSGKNHLPNLPLLRQHLIRQGKLTQEAGIAIIKQARDIFKKEANLLIVHAPVVIIGDIHGQFYDMLNVMDMLGSPNKTQYLFLGDYVDRGDYSAEVLFYLLAHKICYPERVFMLRGNHETRLMCEYMTFLLECNNKYNMKIYNEFLTLFDSLPLSALIEGNINGRVLCMHGGIGPDINTLNDINNINRFMEPPGQGPLTDLLWSDPINEWDPDDPEWEGISRYEWSKITFCENTMRHTSYFYGRGALEPFLQRNNLASIVRGHQVQDEGYFEHTFLTIERPLPLCFTIFSAPNYCDQYNNQGALLSISNSPFDIKTFLWKDHPFQLPEFQDGFSFSLPYLLEHCVRILQDLVISIKDKKQQTIEDVAADTRLKQKTQQLFAKSQKIRENQEKYRAILSETYHKNMTKFEKALQLDKQNEQFPTPEMIALKQSNHTGLLRRGASSPALLQRLQHDQSFLHDQSSKKIPISNQSIPPSSHQQSNLSQMKRQTSKTFKPHPKK
ncbi:serine/threonine protein phosphatase 2B catalytic subunit, putative [Entamoeba dispar SAW760]|uniref:Serine/threonine-protein phosphatase n=1 Tax=Entamoeba dispar (strain ATCC PRA-260 / SAW760) TaxID=370354 RepID=B0EG75_ENTDS|nr:serine/threonine protein phosphatase 2B catalytic subunit, putative [Entamoeba dispar SAW760]EDR26452.1 serine/threonine protein phosphatase 2B catalytic subunit, putative [Entamoeba dispar SAW760]|eukprot:EDR26452.1 serine/threonine protein phosphatase 2B catalytic subunit, putative [Entamoeba dispar SAW760]